MEINSKIEIYKIILGKKTFREVGIEKCQTDERAKGSKVFNAIFGFLLQKLTNNSVWTHEQIKTGLTLFTRGKEQPNNIISSHSNENIIEGYIDGGQYDSIRMMAEKDNVKNRQQLGRNKIITKRYYIYMFLPLGSEVGVLFLERKQGSDIHKAIELFIKETFKTQNAVKLERYIPKSLIKEYEDHGTIDTLTFTDIITTNALDGKGIEQREEKYNVSISIKPLDGDDYSYNKIQDLLSRIGQMTLGIGEKRKKLASFDGKKGKIANGGSKYLFRVDDDLKIRPHIEVEADAHDRDNDILFRDKAKTMCDELLQQIKVDIYPILEEE